MKYFLENITYKNGRTRTDGRYPNRIGSTVSFKVEPMEKYPFCFRYVKYDKGECIEDHISITSPVKSIKSSKEYVVIYTEKSIYHFKKIKEE